LTRAAVSRKLQEPEREVVMVPISEFIRRIGHWLDWIVTTGSEVVVTRHGKPALHVRRAEPARAPGE
jgi:hypothetical protein